MLTASKRLKMVSSIKDYRKKFLSSNIKELDESGTRILINYFLTEVLGYLSIEEVKTEYMIKGTYADYVVQTNKDRHFLVEVKALSFTLTDKHLRQAIEYGANEGIDWALLTNGKNFEFYRIIFGKPIEHKKVLSFDLSNVESLKKSIEDIEFMHKDAVAKKSLANLWNKHSALDPLTLAGLMYNNSVVSFIKRELKSKYKAKFEDEEVRSAIGKLICQPINLDLVKVSKSKPKKKAQKSTASKVVPLMEVTG
jgi:hypothetical protein